VVDDGSIDNTSAVARSFGVTVIRLSPNQGKGQAMLTGVRQTSEPVVVFLDADLPNVQPEQIDQITFPVLQGQFAMVAALTSPARAPFWNQFQPTLPLITGQRAVLRTILNRVPLRFWNGYRIEAGISEMANRAGPVGRVRWENVPVIAKWAKNHSGCAPHCGRKGFEDNVKMFREVVMAFADAQRIP